MTKYYGFQLDNRDLNTTWIIPSVAESSHPDPQYLSDHIEVDPWDLVDNALENAGLPEGVGLKMKEIFEAIVEHGDGGKSVRKVLDLFCETYDYSVRDYLP